MERWKDISEYEGMYQVSNLGNVKSLRRKKWNGFDYQEIVEKILAQKIHKQYKYINLCKSGEQKMIGVHRLVALSFIPNPEGKRYVNHKDNNPSNNHMDNLEWATQAENINHAVRQGRFNQGTLSPRTKFTEEQVKEIRRKILAKEISQTKLAKELGVTQNCISEIVNRLTWKHI
jgi:DNA-binding transcriptional regulator YiaG